MTPSIVRGDSRRKLCRGRLRLRKARPIAALVRLGGPNLQSRRSVRTATAERPRREAVALRPDLPKQSPGEPDMDHLRTIVIIGGGFAGTTLARELDEHVVLAFGNRARLDLIPGLAAHALPLKTVGDAMHIRNIVLRRVARIELETDAALRRRLGHFVVIGGGFSGVETAGELVDCLRSIRRYYPRVAADELKVTVLQDQPRLLLELSERLGRAAQRSLSSRGVDVRIGAKAVAVSADA